MRPVKNVLVIGGGFSGMCAAIQLRKVGVAVDLVEIDAGWRSYGAGISISGASLRALGAIGVLPQIMAQGFCADGIDLFTADGTPFGSIPTPRLAGPDVPGGAGIMRPALAAILAEATRASGTRVRLGVSFTSIAQAADHVDVAFDDGTTGRYDLVVGADGLFSKTRGAVFPHAPGPRYTGQGVWRAVLPRQVERLAVFLGPRIKVGFNPVSRDEMYLFLTEDRPVNELVDPARFAELLGGLLAVFPARLLQDVRAGLGPGSRIVYRPLEALLMPLPWSKGRVVLIGDAVHATTPHLASGAGIAVEDAIVLAEEISRLSSGDEVTGALARFQERRWERCRLVVESSLRLGEIEASGGSQEEHTRIMRTTMAALATPI